MDGLCNDDFVECPEVFEAAATANDEKGIQTLILIGFLDGVGNLHGGGITLDEGWVQKHLDVW